MLATSSTSELDISAEAGSQTPDKDYNPEHLRTKTFTEPSYGSLQATLQTHPVHAPPAHSSPSILQVAGSSMFNIMTSMVKYTVAKASGHLAEHISSAMYPDMIEIQNKAFGQLLDTGPSGSNLYLNLKKAEMATTDLKIVIQASDLRIKDSLAESIEQFVADAKVAGRGLQKLNAQTNGAVDRILAVSDYALQTIEKEKGRDHNVMSMIPYWSSRSVTRQMESVDHLFEQSFTVLSLELERLLLTAETSLAALDGLEEKLYTIHSILTREDSTIQTERDDLLAELWTRLGGNRRRVLRFENNLRLLKELKGYRVAAQGRVSETLQILQTLSADMEDLRQRASIHELTNINIPIEVHARAIRAGAERLKDNVRRAKRRELEVTEAQQASVIEVHDV